MKYTNGRGQPVDLPVLRPILISAGVLLLCVALLVGGCAGTKSFSRYQRLQDAKNRTRVTHQNIRTAAQQALVVRAEIAATKAEAEKKYQESIGIRRAQDEINATLTPLYVQHEAIKSMERGNVSKVYIPVGDGAVPLVNNISANPPNK